MTLSAREIARRVNARNLSAREVTAAHIARVEAHNPALNAVINFDPTAALAIFFESFDLLFPPTAPVTAWPIGQFGPAVIGGVSASPCRHAGFTPLFNYCGVPAVSVPVALVRGLPIGLQIVGPRFADHRVLAFAQGAEQVLGRVEERIFV